MQITDHTLAIDAVSIDLPKLAVDATVHVWTVPSTYRGNGYFVSTQVPGQPMEIPACDGRETVYLGKVTLEADEGAALEAAKDAAVSRLQAEKWTRMTGKMAYDGHTYDIDRDSRDLLTGKVATLAMGKTLPSDFTWKTADKDESGQPIYVPHTADSLKALAFAIDDYTQAIFTASETAQAVVRTETTISGVETAEAAVSWPTT